MDILGPRTKSLCHYLLTLTLWKTEGEILKNVMQLFSILELEQTTTAVKLWKEHKKNTCSPNSSCIVFTKPCTCSFGQYLLRFSFAYMFRFFKCCIDVEHQIFIFIDYKVIMKKWEKNTSLKPLATVFQFFRNGLNAGETLRNQPLLWSASPKPIHVHRLRFFFCFFFVHNVNCVLHIIPFIAPDFNAILLLCVILIFIFLITSFFIIIMALAILYVNTIKAVKYYTLRIIVPEWKTKNIAPSSYRTTFMILSWFFFFSSCHSKETFFKIYPRTFHRKLQHTGLERHEGE